MLARSTGSAVAAEPPHTLAPSSLTRFLSLLRTYHLAFPCMFCKNFREIFSEIYGRALVKLLLAALLILVSSCVRAETVRGYPRVVDGDTLVFGEIVVRLAGIDAPELGQVCVSRSTGVGVPCGEYSRDALAEVVAMFGVVECSGVSRDRWGRLIAVCWYGTGEDIGRVAVQTGAALAYRRYSDAYVSYEDDARLSESGIWSTDFVPPWDWRRGVR